MCFSFFSIETRIILQTIVVTQANKLNWKPGNAFILLRLPTLPTCLSTYINISRQCKSSYPNGTYTSATIVMRCPSRLQTAHSCIKESSEKAGVATYVRTIQCNNNPDMAHLRKKPLHIRETRPLSLKRCVRTIGIFFPCSLHFGCFSIDL